MGLVGLFFPAALSVLPASGTVQESLDERRLWDPHYSYINGKLAWCRWMRVERPKASREYQDGLTVRLRVDLDAREQIGSALNYVPSCDNKKVITPLE